jgi:hypothetical protein
MFAGRSLIDGFGLQYNEKIQNKLQIILNPSYKSNGNCTFIAHVSLIVILR